MAREIGGPVQAHEGRPHSFFFSSDHDFFLADTRRGDGQSGREDRIDIFENRVEFLSDFSFHIESVQVISRAAPCGPVRACTGPRRYICSPARENNPSIHGIAVASASAMLVLGSTDCSRPGSETSSIVAPRDFKHFAADSIAACTSLIDALKKILFGPADPEFARAVLPQLPIIGAGGASRKIAGDRLEHDADIRHSAGHWSGVIERSCERHNTFYAHETERGFQSDDPAERRRNAYRAAGVRAGGGVSNSHRESSRRSSARASRNAIEIPGIPRRAEMRVFIGNAVGKFVHIGFADHDRAGVPEFFDDVTVRIGNEIRKDCVSRLWCECRG